MFNIKRIFKRKIDEAPARGRIDFLKKKFEKSKNKKVKAQERRQRIKNYLERAGINIQTKKLSKIFFDIAVLINLVISAYLIYYFSVTYGITWGTVVASMIAIWVLVFVLLIFALWIM